MNQELRRDEEIQKIKSFTDLNVWKEGHKLVIEVYQLTKKFPREEIFGLTNQIRRAAVSITSNIAEGFSRSSHKDKVHFYQISLGSTTEVENQIIISRDVGYVSEETFHKIQERLIVVNKLCNGLIKKSKTFYS